MWGGGVERSDRQKESFMVGEEDRGGMERRRESRNVSVRISERERPRERQTDRQAGRYKESKSRLTR